MKGKCNYDRLYENECTKWGPNAVLVGLLKLKVGPNGDSYKLKSGPTWPKFMGN